MSRGPALNLQNAPLVIAHRGASRHAPENTCLAVSTAINFGADMVEVDVQLTLDGYAVIFHDSNLGRVGRSTQYGRRQLQFVKIGGLPLQKVKQFDIGRWMSPAFAGLSIPTLEELLATVEGRIGLNLELKVLNAGAKDLCSRGLLIERVRQALRRYSSQSSLLVSSFDVPVLELAHAAFPSLALGVLSRPSGVSETLRIANRVRAFSVHLPCRTITPAIVRSVHQDGYKLFAYTADRVSTWERLIECGVDGIFTNVPDRLRSFLHRCDMASDDHIRPKGQLNYS